MLYFRHPVLRGVPEYKPVVSSVGCEAEAGCGLGETKLKAATVCLVG